MAPVRSGQTHLIERLYADLQRSQEEERRLIARRLHNSTQQNLAAISMSLSLLERQLGPVLNEGARKTLASALGLVATCNEELREIAHTLSPALLELGLAPALRALVAELGEERLGLDIDPLPMPRLDPAIETGAYRLVEEAMKYVFAADVTVRLCAIVDEEGLRLELAGRGQVTEIVDEGVTKLRLRGRPLGAQLRLAGGPESLRLHVRFLRTAPSP